MKKVLTVFLCLVLVFSVLRVAISVEPLSLKEFVETLPNFGFDFEASILSFNDFVSSLRNMGSPLVEWWNAPAYTPITDDLGVIGTINVICGWVFEFLISIGHLCEALVQTVVSPVESMVMFSLTYSFELIEFIADAFLLIAYLMGVNPF